jgi:hypothetical protein
MQAMIGSWELCPHESMLGFTISILQCSSAQALSHGYEAFPLFNDLINSFCRIFSHAICEAF